METNKVQQEILLIIGTTLTSRDLCKMKGSRPNGDTRPNEPLSGNKQLEEACWNGLVPMLLPELCMHTADGGNLYLWEIEEASSFLKLDLGEVPDAIDRHFSIAPCLFLSTQSYN
jgi:hypothetical protein